MFVATGPSTTSPTSLVGASSCAKVYVTQPRVRALIVPEPTHTRAEREADGQDVDVAERLDPLRRRCRCRRCRRRPTVGAEISSASSLLRSEVDAHQLPAVDGLADEVAVGDAVRVDVDRELCAGAVGERLGRVVRVVDARRTDPAQREVDCAVGGDLVAGGAVRPDVQAALPEGVVAGRTRVAAKSQPWRWVLVTSSLSVVAHVPDESCTVPSAAVAPVAPATRVAPATTTPATEAVTRVPAWVLMVFIGGP